MAPSNNEWPTVVNGPCPEPFIASKKSGGESHHPAPAPCPSKQGVAGSSPRLPPPLFFSPHQPSPQRGVITLLCFASGACQAQSEEVLFEKRAGRRGSNPRTNSPALGSKVCCFPTACFAMKLPAAILQKVPTLVYEGAHDKWCCVLFFFAPVAKVLSSAKQGVTSTLL